MREKNGRAKWRKELQKGDIAGRLREKKSACPSRRAKSQTKGKFRGKARRPEGSRVGPNRELNSAEL